MALKKKWKKDYVDFDFVINKLKAREKKWVDISRISPAESFKIMKIIQNKFC